ncbi:hypothetical protein QTN47_12450 [Danxiaibacter flavus]|uniref:Uncharacterized protein n=1 Tax=Danxiaibacter flavus TaxID=3049108 RepID=A0ABV3ZFK2_9BACT|nr:hypothetical protein QNM32_12455 [Chitinophagaceae bacterium DXS]
MKLIYPLLTCLLFSACFSPWSGYNPDPLPPIVKAWVPVYGPDSIYKKVTYIDSAYPVRNAGKIYVLGRYIYQAETGEGIHVIDNATPSNARRIAFIKINGCQEIAMKGNYLYTNNYNDLITVDLSVASKATVVSRQKNAFTALSSSSAYWYLPPPQSGYCVCANNYPDSVIVSWREDSVTTKDHCVGYY